MTVSNLTLATIQRNATTTSYTRGEDYYRAGAVVSVTQRQQALQAEVEGNEPVPYRVTIDFDGGGITNASCTCLYSYEGWCKHIVATLLTCVQDPDAVVHRPTLEQLLDQLNEVQTQRLIQNLVAEHPALIESVDRYVSGLAQPVSAAAPASTPRRRTSVDPAPFKRRAKEILRTAVQGWEYGRDDDDIAFDMGALIGDALKFLDRGDVANAMVALQAITEGCINNWDEIEEFCGLTPVDLDLDFDSAWTEVLLSSDLTTEEILEWQEKLELWQDQLGSFAMALEALRQGWNDAPLVKILEGEPSAQGAWSREAPDWANDFTQIRLKILARQKRYDDYLNLAKAEGQTQRYMTMLAKLGRVDEAVAIAQDQMTTLTEAKALAEMLRSQNQLTQALNVALQGLRLGHSKPYQTFDFATWTSDLAEGMGEAAAALEARILAFKARPSFQDYRKMQALAGPDWPTVKADLLQYLRTTGEWGMEQARIDIFLYEGLLEDAIAVASKLSSYYGDLVLRVMDAAISTHGLWVIENARPRAESIINDGKAKYYDYAVAWLKRMKAAYGAIDQQDAWQQYRQQLTDTHGRKRKLISLMQQNQV